MTSRALLLAACFLLPFIPTTLHADSRTVKDLAPGINFVQETTSAFVINALTVDLSSPGIRLDSAIARDSLTAGTGDITKGREAVRDLAERKQALGVVNADYFGGTGDPLGLGIRNGELYSEPWTRPRVAFGFDSVSRSTLFDVLTFKAELSSGNIRVPIKAINRPLSRGDINDIVVYTQLYGPTSGSRPGCIDIVVSGAELPLQANRPCNGTVQSVIDGTSSPTVIPDDGVVISASADGQAGSQLRQVKPGDKITILARIIPRQAASDAQAFPRVAALPPPEVRSDSWSRVTTGLGGGPRLLKDGTITIDGTDEGFDDGFVNGGHARTAIGATSDGRLVVLTVEGRPFASPGPSLPELAAIIRRYGAINAINLDGGGSTTMALRGVTVNYPNLGTGERRVADMLAIYTDNQATIGASDIALTAPTTPVTVGSTLQMSATLNGKPIQPDDSRLLWAGPVTNGIGYISQDGIFHSVRPGTGVATAVFGNNKLTTTVTVIGRPITPVSYQMIARLTPVVDTASKSTVSIRLNDSSGLPGAKIPITFAVTGGTIDAATVLTDEDGLAKATVTWSASTGSVTVTAGALTPMVLPYDASKMVRP
ncbi:MAG TPA: phosphodiester glycosidase family protein [Capsulimonadaceae bacterium]